MIQTPDEAWRELEGAWRRGFGMAAGEENIFHAAIPFWTVNDDGSRSIELTPGPLPQPRVIWQRLRRLTRRAKRVIARV